MSQILSITFDNPKVCYGPNSAVTGFLSCNLSETRTSVKEIELNLIGEYHYYYYTYTHSKNGRHRHTHYVTQRFLVLVQPVPAIPLNPVSGEIPRGNHSAPFYFVLAPYDKRPLPPSLEYNECYVRYFVEAKIKRSLLRFDDKCVSMPLRFMQPIDVSLPMHRTPTLSKLEATSGCCCWSSGHVDLHTTIPFNVALYGRPMTVELTVKNYGNSNFTITASMCTRLTLLCGRPNDLLYWRPCTAELKRDFAKTVRQETWVVTFEPLTTVQSTLYITDDIQINFAIHLRIDPSGLCNSEEVYMPIFAGLDYHSIMPPANTRFKQAFVSPPNGSPAYIAPFQQSANLPPPIQQPTGPNIPDIMVSTYDQPELSVAVMPNAKTSFNKTLTAHHPHQSAGRSSTSSASSGNISVYDFYMANGEQQRVVSPHGRDAPPAIFLQGELPPLPSIASPNSSSSDRSADQAYFSESHNFSQEGPRGNVLESSAPPSEYLEALEKQ